MMKTSLFRVAVHGLKASVLVLAMPTLLHGVSPDSLLVGRGLFETEWASQNPTIGSDGLGPLFNAKSCVACHHQGGVGGSGDARFNAQAIGIDSFWFSGPATAANNRDKIQLIRSFFPGFVAADGSMLNTASLHHHGGSPEFASWRSLVRNSAGVEFSEQGGPNDASEVQVGLNSPILFTNSTKKLSVTIQARIFQRNTTPLFGSGLIDAIPDEAILRQASIQERHSEISGRPTVFPDGSIGRFGWRSNASNLIRFVDRACANELSLETKRRTQATDPSRPNYRNPSTDISDDQIRAMSQFIAALPRPIQQLPSDSATLAEVQRGSEVFTSIGCAVCHVPTLGKVDGLYSDLLLHDMGDQLYDYDAADPHVITQTATYENRLVEGTVRNTYYGRATSVASANLIPHRFVSPRRSFETSDYVLIAPVSEMQSKSFQVSAGAGQSASFRDEIGMDRKLKPSNTSQEWRTPPLWGVRDSAPYMHDGRAATILEAIALHDGESAGTRDRFLQLPVAYRDALITFLATLVAPPSAPEANL